MSLLKYIERLKRMDDLIRRKATGTPEEFAAKLGLGKSVLMEELSELRELGAKIAYCRERRSYYYEQSFLLVVGEKQGQNGSLLRGGKFFSFHDAHSGMAGLSCFIFEHVSSMRSGIKPSLFFLLVFLNLPTAAVKAQTADSILARIYRSSGGIEKWKALKSVVIEMDDLQGTKKYKVSTRSNSIVLDRWITINKTGDTASTCFNGENYWRHLPNQFLDSYESYASTYAKYSRLSEIDFLMKADSVTYSGITDLIYPSGDIPFSCHTLRVYVNGTGWYYFIDRSSHRVVAYSSATTPKSSLPFNFFSDHRWVGGLLFSFKETVVKNNSVQSEFQVKSIEIDRPISKRIYEYNPKTTVILNSKSFFN